VSRLVSREIKASSRHRGVPRLSLSLSPFNQSRATTSPTLSKRNNQRNVWKTCASRFRCSPYQHFPCWRQAHHQPNVRVTEPLRVIRYWRCLCRWRWRPHIGPRCHRYQTRTSRRECSLLSSLPPTILIDCYIELLRSYLESGSLSFNNILAGRFGLAHSCARGQHILGATYVNGSQRSLTPTGLKSVPRTASYLLSRATGSLDVPIELTMNGFSFEEKRRKT
jgi:hypothetical protein